MHEIKAKFTTGDIGNLGDHPKDGCRVAELARSLALEAVETLVPLQAATMLSLLYQADMKSNSIVSDWSDEDWSQSMMYIGVDLGVELVVFALTVVVLKRMYPEFSAFRILRGLLRTHWGK